MTNIEQLQRWVEGDPVHNEESGQCCPDFSCCKPHLLADVEVRKRFQKAHLEKDARTEHEMLMMFLGAMLGGSEENTEEAAQAYIAGGLRQGDDS